MKYIKLFEKNKIIPKTEQQQVYDMQYDDLMGDILHLYGSIPLTKQKSRVVISKILYPNYFSLKDDSINGNPSDIDLNYRADQDKVRFVDYFMSLIAAKDTRGNNFEGFLAGIYNGNLSEPGEKFDVIIDGKTWSVKFVDIPSKAPEIGSYKKPIRDLKIDNNFYSGKIEGFGLKNLFKSSNIALKEKIWDEVISPPITGGWLIAYPILSKNIIRVNKIDVDTMKQLLMEGHTTAPKGGHNSPLSLAISSSYRNFVSKDGQYKTKHFDIILPKLDLEDLKSIHANSDEEAWSYNVFGNISSKIRPDVLRDIRKNQDKIVNKLLKFRKFKSS